MHAVFIELNDFARFDIADIFCPDGIECAGFAGDDIRAVFALADTQRPNAERVACGLDAVGIQEQQAKRSLQMIEHMAQRVGLC